MDVLEFILILGAIVLFELAAYFFAADSRGDGDEWLKVGPLKIVADGVNALRAPDRTFVVITHYQRLLDYIVPDVVHVLSKGRIVRTGGKELALELEERGYAQYQDEAA